MSSDMMYVILTLLVEAYLFARFLRYFRLKTDVEAVAMVGAMVAFSIFPVDALNDGEVSVWIYRGLLAGGALLVIFAYTLLNFLRSMRGGESAREKKAASNK